MDFWSIILLIGAAAAFIAASGDWRLARRKGRPVHRWSFAGSLILGLLLLSYLVAR